MGNNKRRSFDEIMKGSRRSFEDIVPSGSFETEQPYKKSRIMVDDYPVQQNQAVLDAVQLVNSNASKKTTITDEDRTAYNKSILNQIPENSYDALSKAFKNGGYVGVKFALMEDYGYDENKATDISDRWASDFKTAHQSEKNIENKKAADNWYNEKNKNYESMPDEVKQLAEDTYRKYSTQRQRANSGLAKLKELGYEPLEVMEYMSRKEARAKNTAMQERVENAGGKWNKVQNIASSLATLGQPIDALGQAMSSLTNTPYDPALARYTNYKEAVRNETSNRILEANEGAKGEVLNFMYQTGMSMLDSGLAIGVGALTGSEALSLGLMSSGAASSAYNDAVKRGASKEQALATAFANGTFEALFEKLSLDNLWAMAKPQARTAVKDVLKEIAVQSGIEGSEEVFTSIADALADRIINGSQSEYNQTINDYMIQGMTEAEARNKASKEFALSLASDFAGGAISGGVFGTIGTKVSNYRYNKILENTTDETVSKLYETSKNAAEGTTAKDIADSVDDASKLSDAQKRQMIQSLVEQQSEEISNVLYAELKQNITDTDTLNKAAELLTEYTDSNMTNEQFETKLANEVAKNSAERNAVIEVRNNLANGKYEANMPITTALNSVRNDTVKAEEDRRIVKNDYAVEKQYNKFVDARNKGKENYYSKAKGIAAITVNRNQDGENYADVTKTIGILRTGSKALVALEGGKDAKFEDIEFHDDTMAELYNEAVALPDWKLANIAVKGYKGQLNVKGYVQALKVAYDAGAIDTRTNLSVKDLLNQEQFKTAREIVNDDAAIMQAYYRGQNEAKEKATVKTSRPASNQNKSNAEDIKNSESELKNVLSFVAETFDIKVVEADKLSDNNGKLRSDILGYYFNNMLALNNSGNNNMLQTAFHELMEKVKNEDRENYEFIASNVLAYLQSEKGSQFLSEELTRYQNRYATIEGRSRIENIADEYVNDFISGIFTNEEGINSFVTWAAEKNKMKKQTVFEKIKDFFNTLVAELKNYMSKNTNMKDAARVGFEATGKQIEDIRQLVLKEFDKIAAEESKENTETGSDSRKSFRVDIGPIDGMNLEDRLKDAINNPDLYKNRLVDIGITPDKLVDILDIVQLPIATTREHVYTTVKSPKQAIAEGVEVLSENNTLEDLKNKYHGLGVTRLANAMKELNNPLLIIQGVDDLGNKSTDFIVVTNQKDSAEDNVIVPMAVYRTGSNYITKFYNQVKSAYGRTDTLWYIEEAKKKNRIIYVDENSHNLTVTKKRTPLNRLIGYDYTNNLAEYKKLVKIEEDKYKNKKAFKESIKTLDKDVKKTFSLSESVEETADLIAVHNIHEDDLIKTLKLGGFAMPSLAVMKAENADANENYGEDSVVFDKNTIDPKKNSANKVYSGDAWTPTFPKIDVELDSDKAWEVYDKIKGLADKGGAFRINTSNFHPAVLEDFINREENGKVGEAGLFEKYKNDYSMKQAYLAQSDNQLDSIPVKTEVTKMTPFEVEQSQFLINEMGEDIFKEGFITGGWYKRNGEELENARRKFFLNDPYMDNEIIDEMFEAEKPVDKIRIARMARNYLLHGDTTEKSSEDNEKAHEIIDSRINEKEYHTWLKNLFKGLEGINGIRNDKDVFTPSGKRRKFKELHDEVTLDNIVKAMKRDEQKGAGTLGYSTPIGAATKEFASIEEIRNSKNQLRILDEEEYKKIETEILDRFNEIAAAVRRDNDSYNNYQGILIEAIANSKTKSGLMNRLKKEASFINYSDIVVDDLWNLMLDIQSMPTGYFEAKPQRAVKFNEIKAVVIPGDSSEELKELLNSNNINTIFYDKNIEGDRLEKLNSIKDAKFSLQIPEYTLSDTYAFEYTDDADMEAREKEIERQENNIKEFWKNIITNEKFKALRFEKGADWRKGNPIHYILHPSTRYGIKYQLSYYDNDGAIGHYNYYPEDMEKLYSDLTRETLYEKNREVEIYPPEAEKSFSLADISDEEWESIIRENDNLRQEAARFNKNWKTDMPKEIKDLTDYDSFVSQNEWLRQYIDNYSDKEEAEYDIPAREVLKKKALEETRKSNREYFENIEDIEGEDTTELIARLAKESDWNVRPAEALKEIEEATIYAAQNIEKFKYTDKDVSRIALRLKKGTNLKVETIEAALKGVFDDLIKGGLTHNQVMNIVDKVGKPIIEHTIDTNHKSEWSEMREKLKGTRIRFSDAQIKEINHAYSGNGNTTPYDYYRKSLFGLITITKDETIAPLDDDTWDELSKIIALPANVTAENMPIILKETLDSIETGYKTFETTKKGLEIEEMAYDTALDILQDFLSIQSFMGKAQSDLSKAIGNIKAQQKRYRRKAYERYQAELAKQKRLLLEEKRKNIKQLAREIRDLDAAQLTALEQNDELTAALVVAEKTKAERKLERVKKQNDDKIAEIKARNLDSIARRRELNEKSLLQQQLKKKVDKLNSMLKAPKVNANIKANLVIPTIQMLEAINLDSGRSEVFKDKLARLSELYDRYEKDTNFSGFDYDENTSAMIKQIKALFEGRSYLDLNSKELADVLEVVTRLQQQISNAAKLLENEKYQDAIQTSREIINEINMAKGSTQNKVTQMVDSFFSNQINAERWFRKTSGYKDGAFMSLYKQLDKGQFDMIAMQKEVNDMFAPLLEGNENQENVKRLFSTDEKDMVDIGLTVNGKPVKVTRDMMLSFLLHVQNVDNARHLILGGFTIPNMEEYKKGNYQLAYQGAKIGKFYTMEDIEAAADSVKLRNNKATFDDGVKAVAEHLKGKAKKLIDSELTDWEKTYLATAENLFHDYLGNKINKVTIATRGYALAQTKNYYPIKTDPDFTRTDFAALKQDGSLEGMGFLKDRMKASNPILLEGTTQVILRQTENTSRYVGFSIPVRNINMVMGMQFRQSNESMRSVLKSKWGVDNEKIFQNIMQDIQTGRKEDQLLASAMNTLRGNFAGATLTANVGVAMKQAASFPTAAAELGFKPLIKALNDVGKSAKGQGLEELEAINPLLWYRSKGNSSADIAYAKQSDLYKKLPPKVKAISVDLIQNVDTFTVRTLEYASMYYVDDNFKNLEKGSKAYWEKVSDVFTKTVEHTQPNYTVLQRPEVLKTTNQLAKQLFMFKTQPLQNLGILYDALGEWQQLRRNHAAKADIDASFKKVQKAIASQIIAALTFSAMTILANLGYHKWWKYDKDDDKSMTDEMLTAWATGTASTLSSMVVGGDYLYQFIDQLAFNGTNYGIEVSVLEMINNTEAAIKNIQTYSMKLAEADTEAEAEKYAKKLTANVEDLASLTAKYFGIPFDNIENTLLSPYLYAKDLVMGEAVGSTNVWWNESTETQYLKMFDALVNGNMDRYNKLYNQQIKASESKDPETNVKNKIKGMIQNSYNNQEITDKEAIKYLEDAGIEYKDDVIEGWEYKALTGNTMTQYSKLKDSIDAAIKSKNTSDRKAIKEQIDALVKKGIEISKIKSSITSTYKPIYLANKSADLQNLLITCYMYCGLTKEEALKLIKNWK